MGGGRLRNMGRPPRYRPIREEIQVEDREQKINAMKARRKNDIKDFEERIFNPEYHLVKTGVVLFDRMVNGFAPGSVIGLGGGPGAGKTSFSEMMVEGLVSQGYPSFILITEPVDFTCTRSLIRNGFLQGVYDHSFHSFAEAFHSDREPIDKMMDWYEDHVAVNLAVIQHEGNGVDSIMDLLTLFPSTEICKASSLAPVACIDYIQRMVNDPSENGTQEVARAMYKIKEWAKENDGLAIVVSVKGSETVLNYSDYYFDIITYKDYLGRTFMNKKGMQRVRVNLEKNMTGKLCWRELWFDGKHFLFTE